MVDAHPTEDRWEQLATGELEGASRDELMAHIVACTACARTWRAIRKVTRDARAFDANIPARAPDEQSGPKVVPFVRTRRVLFAGAVVALAASFALVMWNRRETPESADVVRGDQLPVVELASATQQRLAWTSVTGAARYDVELFAADGRAIWQRSVTAAELAIDPALAPGEYRWQVTAWAHGRRIAASRPQRFVVAP